MTVRRSMVLDCAASCFSAVFLSVMSCTIENRTFLFLIVIGQE
ncbi:MAG: hypothetical protein BWY82_00155 [Verrucomicrobia bacterium ADurb.Bin474]|nr:MAG: hypothetical protein BWY82_00155 [Verrucomicrobia bacterium ADurb.Bin474]